MHIDWPATGAMLSGIGTVIGALTIVFAALIGRSTFEDWKRQKREERRMAAAEQVLVLAYRMRRAFSEIRSSGMFGSETAEMDAILQNNGMLTDQTGAGSLSMLRTAQAALSRTARHNTDFEELLSLTPVAKALFGDQVEEALGAFWTQRAHVTVAAQGYADLARQTEPRTEAGLERMMDRRSQIEGRLWEGGGADGPDRIGDAIASAVSTLERELLPIIRGT